MEAAPFRKETYDAIVVGGGGSGLAAACRVAQLGGRVLVLEKETELGGTTGIAVGSYTAAGTSAQQQAGVADKVDDHIEDAGKFAAADIESRNHEELRRYFLRQAAKTFEWLRGLGLSFIGPSPEPPNRVPRMHNVVPGAKLYIAVLQAEILRLGGEIWRGAHVEELLREGDRVVGVRARVLNSHAKGFFQFRAARGVILAGGDYAGSPDLIAKHKGERFRHIEGINPRATGAGQLLAAAVGAKLVNMDVTYGPELRFVQSARKPFQQLLPVGPVWGRLMGTVARALPAFVMKRLIKRLLVTWQHPENALFDDGAILINRGGERFVNETQWPEREIALAQQPDKIGYLLLDGRLVEKYSAWPHFVSTAPDIVYAYVRDYQRLRPDVTRTASNLDELARLANLKAGTLKETVARFNACAEGKEADAFGRAGARQPLERGPWVLLGPVKAYFTTTEGGAAIDQSLRVLDESGQFIPGLYAVGQNGLGGMILFGHGLHIAWALTSGRLAAEALMHA